MKTFIFNWQINKKYNPNVTRTKTKIKAIDAKTATDAFMKNFGNLKKNTINLIQEVDELNQPIGEKIVPND